jgi:hypothetical protein
MSTLETIEIVQTTQETIENQENMQETTENQENTNTATEEIEEIEDMIVSINTVEFQKIPLPENDVVPTDRRFLNRPEATIDQLIAINVDPAYSEWIRVFDTHKEAPDSEETLYLLHYITVANDMHDTMKHIGHVRGIILDQNNNIICQSFGYTKEVTPEQFTGNTSTNTNNKYYPVYEGTVIRLFFHDHWFISTHRKIDATYTRWNGPTFGEMFQEIFDGTAVEKLSETNVYIYILQHVDHRQLLPVKESRLIHVADFKGKLIPTMTAIEITDISKYVEDAFDTGCGSTGVGLLTFVNDTPVKIVSERYLDLKNVRGNDPMITTRYIHLFGEPEKQKILVKYFPDYRHEFTAVNKAFESLAKEIHRGYIGKFVKRLEVTFPKENHVVMMRCHSWHKLDAKNNIVRLDTVKQMLRTTPANYLNTMIGSEERNRRFLSER